uniref:Uncharacterized protein n=1 Tax=Physcomitrium patens TaxID=3218 RepID=A0A7I3ZAB1_PHYPA
MVPTLLKAAARCTGAVERTTSSRFFVHWRLVLTRRRCGVGKTGLSWFFVLLQCINSHSTAWSCFGWHVWRLVEGHSGVDALTPDYH